MKEYFTIEEVESGQVVALPIPRSTQARYRKEGLLPYIKIGRRIFYSKKHIEHLFKMLENRSVIAKEA